MRPWNRVPPEVDIESDRGPIQALRHPGRSGLESKRTRLPEGRGPRESLLTTTGDAHVTGPLLSQERTEQVVLHYNFRKKNASTGLLEYPQ